MKPRERVLAALHRQPVDRIPYCEHLVDANVAQKTVGPLKSMKIMLKLARKFGYKNLLTILQASRKPDRMASRPELMALGFRFMTLSEPLISKELHRDNITYWGGASCFEGTMYLLNPDQKHLGPSADGVLKSFSDLDKMVFRKDIDRIMRGAEEFIQNKGDLAAWP
jgi:hypothetical protein